jgi:hypothetical protein
VTELRTFEIEVFKNDIYDATDYQYNWTGPSAEKSKSLFGKYRSREGTPPEKDDYTFAIAAERAWTAFAYQRARKELAANGAVAFNGANGDSLRLGSGVLDITKDGQTVRCATSDMTKLQVEKGVVTLSTKNSSFGFFGSKGTYKFKYHDIANAQLFLMLFDSLVAS